MHNFKAIRFPLLGHEEYSGNTKHARFDHLLLEMIDLVAQRWGYIETDRFGLTGYSGGAQVGAGRTNTCVMQFVVYNGADRVVRTSIFLSPSRPYTYLVCRCSRYRHSA